MSKDTKYQFFSKELMEKIRSQFYYVDHCPYSNPSERIFLDSASGSLRLKEMVKRVQEESALPDNFGRDNEGSKHAEEVLKKGEEDVRIFLGAQRGEIMVAQSSTHAAYNVVSTVIGNNLGSNIVTTNLEHPCIYDSTKYFCQLYKQDWRVAPLSAETGAVPVTQILELIDEKTSLLGLIHGSNITGAVNDVATIVKEARRIKEDLFIAVDGVQYAPHGPVDVEALDVDAYFFGGYKTFCTKGFSFCYLSDRLATLPHFKLLGKPDKDWELGSKDNGVYGGWSACVDYLAWLGSQFSPSHDRKELVRVAMERIKIHTSALLERILYGTEEQKGLLAMDHVKIFGLHEDLSNRIGLVAFNVEGMDSYQGVKEYGKKKIRIHNRVSDEYSKHVLDNLGSSEIIRLSTCHYNTPEEIDYYLKVTEGFKG